MGIINWENLKKFKASEDNEINLDFISENRTPDHDEQRFYIYD